MTYELWILIWAAMLGLVHVLLSPVVCFSTPGYIQWNAGPRDQPFEKPAAAQRLDRAFNNFKETFVFFAVIVIALVLSRHTTHLSMWGSTLYLIARIAYVPLYAFGIKGFRSLAWVAALAGMLMCFTSLFI